MSIEFITHEVEGFARLGNTPHDPEPAYNYARRTASSRSVTTREIRRIRWSTGGR